MITTPSADLPTDVDVAVIGSGAAGLTAATRAAEAHTRVIVVEKAHQLGGTTAVGGGVIWAPANPLAAAAGYPDSREDARAYVLAASAGAMSETEARWYVETAAAAVDYLCTATRVRLAPLARPDYRLEFPGATEGGRSLDNAAFDVGAVPGLSEVLRPSSYFPLLTMAERDDLDGSAAAPELLARRAELGVRTMGGALAASLLMSAIDRDVSVAVDAAVGSLDRADDDRWLLTLHDGTAIRADSVIIASGGFEWNPRLQAAFLPHPITPISAPSNEGDGLELGLRLGGAVSDMTSFWGVPVITAPGQVYDGRPSGRMGNVEMTLPGSITVGADGKRFVNEALNYHDAARVFGATDAARLSPKGDPAWLIVDRQYLDSYPIAGSTPGSPADWMVEAETIEALAEAIEVDPTGLADQVARFNADAAIGIDEEFGRGSTPQDRFLGDSSITPNPCLRGLTRPPFYAVPVRCGALGTSGGLSTDAHGRVIDFSGIPIDGLYAAGNVSASVFHGAYPGGGATLGSAVVRGYAAGSHIADGRC
ncbi:FAD-dependent oxidoreductase [Brevibacterium oceani]|uniref:FAD-dependent oxidoreductase n=1 Tax=Brevibacterium oceani TaxID=358099 RepID=UPI0015E71B1A|nr:FAD-dependent oxidoreductase [Brevibacterium oceani]